MQNNLKNIELEFSSSFVAKMCEALNFLFFHIFFFSKFVILTLEYPSGTSAPHVTLNC